MRASLTTFEWQLACLLWNHPLWNFVHQGRLELLLGQTTRAKQQQALRQLLQQGQLQATALHLHIISKNPKADARALLLAAPDLHRFAQLDDAPAAEAPLAYLHFYSPEQPVPAGIGYAVLPEAENKKLASDLPEGCLVAGFGLPKQKKRQIVDLQKLDLRAFRQEMDPLLFNIQRVYDPNGTAAEIRRSFDLRPQKTAWPQTASQHEKPLYNYRSNLGAVLHLHAKAAALGICLRPGKLDAAAAELHTRLAAQGTDAENTLMVLEHNRWVMEKVFFLHQLPDEEFETQFYQLLRDENQQVLAQTTDTKFTGTQNAKTDWHCCLVPCTARSRLTGTDFEHYHLHLTEARTIDATEKEQVLKEIDERCNNGEIDHLDRITLRVRIILQCISHARWAEITECARWLHRCVLPAPLQKEVEDLRSQLTAMHDKGSYYDCLAFLSTTRRLSALLQNTNRVKEHQKLAELVLLAKPLTEFAIRKDYKEADRRFARQLPFILTHREEHTVFKLLAQNPNGFVDDVAGIWLAVPQQVVCLYPDTAEGRQCFCHLRDFLSENNCVTRLEPAPLPLTGSLTRHMEKLLTKYKPLYTDTTGCADQQLLRAYYAAGNSVPVVSLQNRGTAFAVEQGSGLEWLQYSLPRPFSVEASLQMVSGQSHTSTSKEALNGISSDLVNHLWQLSRQYRDEWFVLSRSSSQSLSSLVGKGEKYHTLLRQLYRAGVIEWRLQAPLKNCFRSEACRILFSLSGDMLELYIYQNALWVLYSAAHSVQFYREDTGDGSAEAELDIVATTQNGSTLFISCKDMKSMPLTECKSYLNEIRYEAEHYGWNGVPVLISTAFQTFAQGDDCSTLSDHANTARNKYCCAIGNDIIASGLLPMALEQIAENGVNWYEQVRPELAQKRKKDVKQPVVAEEPRQALPIGKHLKIQLLEGINAHFHKNTKRRSLILDYHGTELRIALKDENLFRTVKNYLQNRETVYFCVTEYYNNNISSFYWVELV